MPKQGKKRVAILGGGVSAMTTAFYLSSYKGWKDDWEIDVYQMGWRLGGKGASGRNRKQHQRIEEHGLHIFLGFYDNAFKTMQELYAELARSPGQPLATWDEAWKPADYVAFMEQVKGEWKAWEVNFPRRPGTPGDASEPLSGWGYVQTMLSWIAEWLQQLGFLDHEDDQIVDRLVGEVDQTRRAHPGKSGEWRVQEVVRGLFTGMLQRVVDGIEYVASLTQLDNQLIHAAIKLAATVDAADDSDTRHSAVGELVRRVRDWVRSRVATAMDEDDRVRRLFILIDLTTAAINGMIHDDLVGDDPYWFKIDDQSFRSWIMKHGAQEMTAHCGPIEAAYALAFGEKTELGAGTAMHGILLLILGYKGSIFWEMQAGMGDTIFAPYYEVLRRRGVRFHFFHRVDRLEMSADGARVAKIHIGRQVETKGATYRPLVDVKGLPSWPSEPLYDQLVDGDQLEKSGCDLEDWWTTWKDKGAPLVLEDGTDYDMVVLGTAIATFPYIATEVMDRSLPFKLMTEQVVTTQTQCMQLWFKPDLEGLGWGGCPAPPIVGAYALWMDTWADLSHLLEREDWPAETRPGNLAYLVSRMLDDEPMPARSDHGYTARQHARVRANALEWLALQAGTLWPPAADKNDPRALNWYFLFDEQERDGAGRFEAQFIRGILNPSERYVLSEPGTTKYRLRPNETGGIVNLIHVGDHTFTGVNAGCVEAAVQSGMAGAQALCGYPAVIPGDVLPRSGPWGER
jgi:uncharacterized protein with NAD-binding domain and iron-sulfur cluster